MTQLDLHGGRMVLVSMELYLSETTSQPRTEACLHILDPISKSIRLASFESWSFLQ